MKSSIFRMAADFLREKKSRRYWLMAIVCLALAVVAGTWATLKMTGQAKTQEVRLLDCQLEVHQHTADCYDREGELICGYADFVVHTHNDDCYSDGHLVCALPEVQIHQHTAECYGTKMVLGCGLEEADGEPHVHTEECFSGGEQVLICGQDDTPHVHTDDCYVDGDPVFVCELEDEEHIHDDECWMIPQVLNCGLEEGEAAHQHTDECYSTEDVAICGLEEGETARHIHTMDCFVEEEALTCGMDEVVLHTHDDSCFETVYVDAQGDVVAYAADLAENAVIEGTWESRKFLACGQLEVREHHHTESEGCFEILELTTDEVTIYINQQAITIAAYNAASNGNSLLEVTKGNGGMFSVTFSKNGKETGEFENGDEFQLDIYFTIPADPNLKGRTFYYKLPEELKISDYTDNGQLVFDVTQGGNVVGKVTVVDGQLVMELYGDIDPSIGIRGRISVSGMMDFGSSNETHEVEIDEESGSIHLKEKKKTDPDPGPSGGDVTPTPPPSNPPSGPSYDLQVDKTSGEPKRTPNGWELDYEVTVSTTNGSGGTINFEDWFTSNLKGTVKGSITVEGPNGESAQLTVGPDGKITGTLPELQPGQSYKIKYTVEVTDEQVKANAGSNGQVSLGNRAKAWNENDSSQKDHSKQVQGRQVRKTGSFDNGTQKFTWTIWVSENNAGQVVRDEPKGDLAALVGDGSGITVTITCAEHEHDNITLKKLMEGYQIPADDNCAHTFTFETGLPDNLEAGRNINYTNWGWVGGYHDETNQGSNRDPWKPGKTARFDEYEEDPEDGKNTKLHVTWQGSVTFPTGQWEDATYKDSFVQWVYDPYSGNTQTIDAPQYAEYSEIKEKLEKELEDKIKALGQTGLTATVTYYTDENWTNKATKAGDLVKSFQIDFHYEGDSNAISGKTITFEYKTTTDVSKLQNGLTYEIYNDYDLGGQTGRAKRSFKHQEIPEPALKKGAYASTSKNKSYGSMDLEITYDPDKDTGDVTVYYQIIYRFRESDYGKELTITDLLPEEMELNENSISVGYWNGTQKSGSLKETHDVKSSTLTVKIGADLLTAEKMGSYTGVVLQYSCTIDHDTLAELIKSGKTLTNTAKVGTETVDHGTTVVKPVLEKKGTQREEGSDLIDYQLVINPEGRMLAGGGKLTLTDTISAWTANGNVKHFNLYLDYSSVKLYRYDPTQPGNRGELLDYPEDYSFTVKDKSTASTTEYELTVKVPDGMALLLEYTYSFDNYDEQGKVTVPLDEITLKNTAKLEGYEEVETKTEMKKASGNAWIEQGAFSVNKVDADSGKPLAGATFDIYRWDGPTSGGSKSNWTKIATVTTDESGQIKFNMLYEEGAILAEPGSIFAIREVSAPTNYEIIGGQEKDVNYVVWLDSFNPNLDTPNEWKDLYGNGNSIPQLTGGAGIQEAQLQFIQSKNKGTVEITNKRMVDDVVVEKVNQYYEALEGAQFNLYEADGNGGWNLVDGSPFTTDAKGHISDLQVGQKAGSDGNIMEYGKLYALVETEAPEGHLLPSKNATYFWFENPNGGSSQPNCNSYIDGALPEGAKNGLSSTDDLLKLTRDANTIRVVNETASTRITVKKNWKGDAGIFGEDGLVQPSEIKVTLKRYLEGTSIDTAEVVEDAGIENPVILTREDGWEYTWPELLRQDANGRTYLYFVTETVPDGYTVRYENNSGIDEGTITVTNTYHGDTPDQGEIKVEKKWAYRAEDGSEGPMDDRDHDGITVELWRRSKATDSGTCAVTVSYNVSGSPIHFNDFNGTQVKGTFTAAIPKNSTLTVPVKEIWGGCTATINYGPNGELSDVITYENGKREFSCNVGDADQYILTIDASGYLFGDIAYTAPVPDDSGVDVVVPDELYNMSDDADLIAAGWEKVSTVTLSSANNWMHVWENLADGYEYFVRELAVSGCDTSYTTTYYEGDGDAGIDIGYLPGPRGTVTVTNTSDEEAPAFKLPETGGIGMMLAYVGAGAIFLAVAGCCLTLYRKRRYQ